MASRNITRNVAAADVIPEPPVLPNPLEAPAKIAAGMRTVAMRAITDALIHSARQKTDTAAVAPSFVVPAGAVELLAIPQAPAQSRGVVDASDRDQALAARLSDSLNMPVRVTMCANLGDALLLCDAAGAGGLVRGAYGSAANVTHEMRTARHTMVYHTMAMTPSDARDATNSATESRDHGSGHVIGVYCRLPASDSDSQYGHRLTLAPWTLPHAHAPAVLLARIYQMFETVFQCAADSQLTAVCLDGNPLLAAQLALDMAPNAANGVAAVLRHCDRRGVHTVTIGHKGVLYGLDAKKKLYDTLLHLGFRDGPGTPTVLVVAVDTGGVAKGTPQMVEQLCSYSTNPAMRCTTVAAPQPGNGIASPLVLTLQPALAVAMTRAPSNTTTPVLLMHAFDSGPTGWGVVSPVDGRTHPASADVDRPRWQQLLWAPADAAVLLRTATVTPADDIEELVAGTCRHLGVRLTDTTPDPAVVATATTPTRPPLPTPAVLPSTHFAYATVAMDLAALGLTKNSSKTPSVEYTVNSAVLHSFHILKTVVDIAGAYRAWTDAHRFANALATSLRTHEFWKAAKSSLIPLVAQNAELIRAPHTDMPPLVRKDPRGQPPYASVVCWLAKLHLTFYDALVKCNLEANMDGVLLAAKHHRELMCEWFPLVMDWKAPQANRTPLAEFAVHVPTWRQVDYTTELTPLTRTIRRGPLFRRGGSLNGFVILHSQTAASDSDSAAVSAIRLFDITTTAARGICRLPANYTQVGQATGRQAQNARQLLNNSDVALRLRRFLTANGYDGVIYGKRICLLSTARRAIYRKI